METFKEAVDITFNEQAEQAAKANALEYLQQIENDPQSWKMCLDWLVSDAFHQETARFVCLKVVERSLSLHAALMTQSDRTQIRTILMRWLSTPVGLQQPFFIFNKIAHVLVLLFRMEYPATWPDFFKDMTTMAYNSTASTATDMTLRVFRILDEEVVDLEIVRTRHQHQTNVHLKDAMRERDMSTIVQFWLHVLSECTSSDAVEACLDVIARYTDWIDIGLVASPPLFPMICNYLHQSNWSNLTQGACQVIKAMAEKGMPSQDKVLLIQKLQLVDRLAHVMQQAESAQQTETLESVGNAVSAIGSALVESTSEIAKGQSSLVNGMKDTVMSAALSRLEPCIQLMIRILTNEMDDVAETVVPFASQFVYLLKQREDLQSSAVIQNLTRAVVIKMEMDSDYAFDDEDNDEAALFDKFRRDLGTLLKNLTAVSPVDVVAVCRVMVLEVLSTCAQQPWTRLELVLHIVYLLTEYLPREVNHRAAADKHQVIAEFVKAVIASRVVMHGHRAVCMAALEVYARCSRKACKEVGDLQHTIDSFFGCFGCMHPCETVRSRACYLFGMSMCRDEKTCQLLAPHLDSILDTAKNFISFDAVENQSVAFDDQLYLVEGLGWLLGQHVKTSPQHCLEILTSMLGACRQHFYELVERALPSCQDIASQLRVVQHIVHVINFVVRISKALPNREAADAIGAANLFRDITLDFIKILTLPCHRASLHAGFRMFYHRMIILLGVDVLTLLPHFADAVLSNPEAEDLGEFVLLLHHVMTKFRSETVPYVDRYFVPVCSSIFKVLQLPCEPNDMEALRIKRSLRTTYFNFLHALTSSGLTHVLSSPTNAPHMIHVLQTIMEGTHSFDDPRICRKAFVVLNKALACWLASQHDESLLAFVKDTLVPACFSTPLQPRFDLNEAQFSLAITDIASIVLQLTRTYGQDFASFVLHTILPSVNLSSHYQTFFQSALHEALHPNPNLHSSKVIQQFGKQLKQLFIQVRQQQQ